MHFFEAANDLGKQLSCCMERKHSIFVGYLVIHEVASVAVLQHHIVELIVFVNWEKLDDIVADYVFHAFYLALEVFVKIGILAEEFLLVNHFECKLLSIFIFDE